MLDGRAPCHSDLHLIAGVLPLAAGESMAGKWIQAQLAARLVDKEYLCLCAQLKIGKQIKQS